MKPSPPKFRFRPALRDPGNPANWGPLVGGPVVVVVPVAAFFVAQTGWRKDKK